MHYEWETADLWWSSAGTVTQHLLIIGFLSNFPFTIILTDCEKAPGSLHLQNTLFRKVVKTVSVAKLLVSISIAFS
uniref:Uncharacterized protein n=1 Tax=Anguilla anguilla TaxID=7936 RepID=A0A0E9SEM1_ANGAN